MFRFDPYITKSKLPTYTPELKRNYGGDYLKYQQELHPGFKHEEAKFKPLSGTEFKTREELEAFLDLTEGLKVRFGEDTEKRLGNVLTSFRDKGGKFLSKLFKDLTDDEKIKVALDKIADDNEPEQVRANFMIHLIREAGKNFLSHFNYDDILRKILKVEEKVGVKEVPRFKQEKTLEQLMEEYLGEKGREEFFKEIKIPTEEEDIKKQPIEIKATEEEKQKITENFKEQAIKLIDTVKENTKNKINKIFEETKLEEKVAHSEIKKIINEEYKDVLSTEKPIQRVKIFSDEFIKNLIEVAKEAYSGLLKKKPKTIVKAIPVKIEEPEEEIKRGQTEFEKEQYVKTTVYGELKKSRQKSGMSTASIGKVLPIIKAFYNYGYKYANGTPKVYKEIANAGGLKTPNTIKVYLGRLEILANKNIIKKPKELIFKKLGGKGMMYGSGISGKQKLNQLIIDTISSSDENIEFNPKSREEFDYNFQTLGELGRKLFRIYVQFYKYGKTAEINKGEVLDIVNHMIREQKKLQMNTPTDIRLV